MASFGHPESSPDSIQEMLLQDFVSYFLKSWLPVTQIEWCVISLQFFCKKDEGSRWVMGRFYIKWSLETEPQKMKSGTSS